MKNDEFKLKKIIPLRKLKTEEGKEFKNSIIEKTKKQRDNFFEFFDKLLEKRSDKLIIVLIDDYYYDIRYTDENIEFEMGLREDNLFLSFKSDDDWKSFDIFYDQEKTYEAYKKTITDIYIKQQNSLMEEFVSNSYIVTKLDRERKIKKFLKDE